MLESYVTPILMSYVNRYIKNLKPSDLQLSLWGGDVVLSKLELKLDVLEQELKLPFTFLSGHIHELRIHVPWTKLGSEPVVITINTMECILKLKDGLQVLTEPVNFEDNSDQNIIGGQCFQLKEKDYSDMYQECVEHSMEKQDCL